MENTPEVLVVVDNDMAYGIQHGFYENAMPAQGCKVMSIDEFNASQLFASSAPTLNGKDIYILNPYVKDTYICIEDANLEKDMIDNRAFAVREALVMMGAKDISLVENISDNSEEQTNVNIDAKVGVFASGNVQVKNAEALSINIKSHIESHDENRQPHTAEKVYEYLRTHGLSSDTNLILLAQRLERDGRLCGTEAVHVTFCSEIKSALNILSSFNYKIFNSELDIERKKSNVHTIEKTLKVNFG